jgi:hypothetical protein
MVASKDTAPGSGFLCPCCHCTGRSHRFSGRTISVPPSSRLLIRDVPTLPRPSYRYRLCRLCTAIHQHPHWWRESSTQTVPGPPHEKAQTIVLPSQPAPLPPRPYRPFDFSALPRRFLVSRVKRPAPSPDTVDTESPSMRTTCSPKTPPNSLPRLGPNSPLFLLHLPTPPSLMRRLRRRRLRPLLPCPPPRPQLPPTWLLISRSLPRKEPLYAFLSPTTAEMTRRCLLESPRLIQSPSPSHPSLRQRSFPHWMRWSLHFVSLRHLLPLSPAHFLSWWRRRRSTSCRRMRRRGSQPLQLCDSCFWA